MAYRHHHHAPALGLDPAPDPASDSGPTDNPVSAAPDFAPLPAPSMAASLATAPASRAALSDAEDATHDEHLAFHRHRMEKHVFANLWRQA